MKYCHQMKSKVKKKNTTTQDLSSNVLVFASYSVTKEMGE